MVLGNLPKVCWMEHAGMYRVDEHANRMELYADKNIRKYYWSFWSAICLQHKRVMITLLLFLIPIYKMFRSMHQTSNNID